jgi:hypothetical protein
METFCQIIETWKIRVSDFFFNYNSVFHRPKTNINKSLCQTVHGKWWDPAWLQDLMPTMERYLRDEQIGDKGRRIVEESIDLLERKFNEYRSEP